MSQRSHPRWLSGTLASLLALLVPHVAHAQSLRYGTTQPGGVVAVGNTLGLSKAPGENGPGVADSIGTFIALDPASVDAMPVATIPWTMGTTSDWTKNGSSAKLFFVDPSTEVLYAELVWGGSVLYGGESVVPYLDKPILLQFGPDKIQATPDPTTSHTLDYVATGLGTDARYYSRSADVTQFVHDHASGVYTVSGVPGTQVATNDGLNAAGWSLIVAYRREGDPVRAISVVVGNDDLLVDVDSSVDYAGLDFCAPPTGSVGGSVAIAALEGDATKSGDSLVVAPDATGPFVALTGPNNRADNFFASQINDSLGILDTTGTFGMLNHDAAAGVNVTGGRQGFDVTNVSLSSSSAQLANDQRSIVLRAETTKDTFLPLGAGIAVDVTAPHFSSVNSVVTASPTFPSAGDFVTITATVLNEGTASADAVHFTLGLPNGASLSSFSTDGVVGDVNHKAVVASDLATGVDLGAIAPGAMRKVEIVVLLDLLTTGSVAIEPKWAFEYTTCTGQAPLTETYRAKATIAIHTPDGPTVATSSGVGGGGGSGGGPATPPTSSDCSCSLGGDETHGGIWVALVGVLGLFRRRRGRA